MLSGLNFATALDCRGFPIAAYGCLFKPRLHSRGIASQFWVIAITDVAPEFCQLWFAALVRVQLGLVNSADTENRLRRISWGKQPQ
jgi:hypothetical protein